MKKNFILAVAVLFTANAAFGQNCITEDFSNSPAGWTLSQGARITDYKNPLAQCGENMGIITPGVGGHNPCNIRTPTYTSLGANSVQLNFDIFVFDANMKCDTWKDFDCQTSVDVYYFAGGTKYTGIVDQVLPPNGPSGVTNVTVNVPVGANLPAGTQYEIQLEFKFKSGVGNCVQQNTKYVIDNFRRCESVSNTFAGGPVKPAAADLVVSPNPANGASELKINTTIRYDRVQLVDNSGNIIRTANNKTGTINISGLTKGIYYIRVEKEDAGVSVTKRIIIN